MIERVGSAQKHNIYKDLKEWEIGSEVVCEFACSEK